MPGAPITTGQRVRVALMGGCRFHWCAADVVAARREIDGCAVVRVDGEVGVLRAVDPRFVFAGELSGNVLGLRADRVGKA